MSWTRLRVTSIGPEDFGSVYEVERSLEDPWSRMQLEDELQQPGAWQMAVRPQDGATVLAYVFGRTIVDEAEILRLAVLPVARRLGVATFLLAHVLEQLGRDRVSVCHLEVRATNRAARALYEKTGFAVTGRRRGYYKNPPEDAVLMAKEMAKGEQR